MINSNGRPQFILHSVLASRILFNLRKVTHNTDSGGMGYSLTQFLTTMEYDDPTIFATTTRVGQEDIELVRVDEGGSSRADPESLGNT